MTKQNLKIRKLNDDVLNEVNDVLPGVGRLFREKNGNNKGTSVRVQVEYLCV